MDNIFGIGLPEFVLIVVIAGMVMGPERIAQSARALGRLTARVQAISRTFFRQLNAELDSMDESGELRSTFNELDLLRKQVTDLKKEVLTLTSGAAAEGTQAIRDIKSEAQNSIMPPNLMHKSNATLSEQGPDRGTLFRPSQQLSPAEIDTPDGGSARPALVPLPNRIDVPEDPAE